MHKTVRILCSGWLLLAAFALSAPSSVCTASASPATLLPSPIAASANPDSLTLLSAQWHVDTLHGMLYKQVRFCNHDYFASNQCISLLEIPAVAADYPSATPRQHAVAFSHSIPRSLTHTQATAAGAVAAINGTFFDMQQHHSICYLRIDGKEIAHNEPGKDTVNRKYYQTGTLCIDSLGRVSLHRTAPPLHWERYNITTPHAMTSGPLLIYRNAMQPLRNDRTFVTQRHNRTAVGLRPDGTLLLVAVDGRRPEAQGMSLFELAATLRYLGCVEALNLDGGGSTTLWIADQAHHGVMNYPSDNGRFDHAGERTVNNCLLVLPSQ